MCASRLAFFPKRGATSPSQRKWHPLSQNTKHLGTDPIQKVTEHHHWALLVQGTRPAAHQASGKLLTLFKICALWEFQEGHLWDVDTTCQIESVRRPPSKDGYLLHHCTNWGFHTKYVRTESGYVPWPPLGSFLSAPPTVGLHVFPSHGKTWPCSFRN